MKTGLLLAVGDFPEGNATASRLNLLSRTLAEGGFDMTVGLIHATLREPHADNAGVSGRLGPVRFEYFNRSVTRPAGALAALQDTVRGVTAATGFVREAIREGRLDFIVLYTPNRLKIGPILKLARRHDIPLLLEACEIRSHTTGACGRPPLRRRLANSLDAKLEKSASRVVRGVIAISSPIADYYAALGVARDAIFRLPILVDPTVYAKRSPAVVEPLRGRRFFFNSGSFAEKDGVGYLVRAFAKTARDHPGLLLAFSGAADETTRARVIAGLDGESAGRVVFTGYLKREQLIWCYQNAAALMSCRSNSAYAHYGFPTKLAEYLASGTPVVATEVGDIGGYLSDGVNVYLARPEDVESIAAAMNAVLDDPAHALVVARAGREAAAAFDYRAYVNALAEFVNRHTDR